MKTVRRKKGASLKPGNLVKLADLFCGAGGTSTGAVEAIEMLGYHAELTAINHWPVAIATHDHNHPGARTLCTGIDAVRPLELYKEGELDLLWASPECTHHSTARGGKPINDQSRATAWCVIRWAEALRPPVILIENVPEFRTWGPIGTDGRPLKSRKGEIFKAWCLALESIGYRVEHRMLCAADYGDPTTRTRLFVQAVRGNRRCVWPTPTHTRFPEKFPGRKAWVAAREIIDWSIAAPSIYDRKRPLSEKTMKRIMAGLKKFGLKDFVLPKEGVHGGNVARDINEPVPTVVTDGRVHVVHPFLTRYQGDHADRDNSERCAQGLDLPLGSISTENRYGFVEPYLVTTSHSNSGKVNAASWNVHGLDEPLGSVTSASERGLAVPFLIPQHSSNGARSIMVPAPTVTTTSRGIGLVQAFLVPNFGERDGQEPRTHDLAEPLPAVTSHGAGCLVEPVLAELDPFIVAWDNQSGSGMWSADVPLSTIVTKARHGVAQPFLVELRGTTEAALERTSFTVDGPCSTVTASGLHHALAVPFLVKMKGQSLAVSIEAPCPTLTAHAPHLYMAQAYLVQVAHGNGSDVNGDNRRAKSLDDPLGTVCGQRGDMALIQPALLPQQSGGALRWIGEPAPTVSATGAIGFVNPFLVKYYGSDSGAQDVGEPLDTVTAKHRHALVRPIIEINGTRYQLDIGFRMLQPKELAAAQGFRRDYHFTGTKTDAVKQIGNAVPRNLARALVLAALGQDPDIAKHFKEGEVAA